VSAPEPNRNPDTETTGRRWKGLYRLGGITALIILLLPPAEIGIDLIPGLNRAPASVVTVLDWFTLFQNHWFLGLRNLGLLNLVGAALLAPTILAVYSALQRESEAFSALGTILFLIGVGVYFANNKAFAMLSLSRQYASATSDAQRALFAAAGQATLAEGESRAGLLLVEFACLVISAVMLRGKTFSKATAYAGILGNALLMAVEILFVPVSTGVGMVVAACAGISIMTWYLLTGRRLLQLARL
jgi:hypothetical protein